MDTVLGNSKISESESLNQLQFLGQVCKESLRMYPPVGALGPRRTLIEKELRWPGTEEIQCVIPANIDLEHSVITTHRNPEIWQNPMNHYCINCEEF